MRRAFLLVVLLLGCRRDPPAPSPITTTAPTTPSSSTAPVASASSTAGPPVLTPQQAVVQRWSDALDARDVKALGALHTDEVRFYGSRISNADYVARIKKALDADPKFHQTITFTNVEWRNSTNVKVSFRKKDDKRETPAYLVVQRQLPRTDWLIVEESDVPSDAIPPTCYDYGKNVTLTGTVDESAYMVNDVSWPATILRLERPICVRQGKDEFEDRVESIEELHLREGDLPKPGKRSVTGQLHHQDGSPYYASAVAMIVDSSR